MVLAPHCRVHIQRSRPESEPRDHVTGLLLVLAGSRGDHRVLEYGVRLSHRSPDARIGLLQLLASLPPELLEFGGAEDPDRERRLDAQLKSRQHEWMGQAETEPHGAR